MPDELGEPAITGWHHQQNESSFLNELKQQWSEARGAKFLALAIALALPPLGYFLRNGMPLVAFNIFSYVSLIKIPKNRSTDRWHFVKGIYARLEFRFAGKWLGTDEGEMWVDDGLLKFIGSDTEFAISAANFDKQSERKSKVSAKERDEIHLATLSGERYSITIETLEPNTFYDGRELITSWLKSSRRGAAVNPPLSQKPSLLYRPITLMGTYGLYFLYLLTVSALIYVKSHRDHEEFLCYFSFCSIVAILIASWWLVLRYRKIDSFLKAHPILFQTEQEPDPLHQTFTETGPAEAQPIQNLS